jgi:hypothetical protein
MLKSVAFCFYHAYFFPPQVRDENILRKSTWSNVQNLFIVFFQGLSLVFQDSSKTICIVEKMPLSLWKIN